MKLAQSKEWLRNKTEKVSRLIGHANNFMERPPQKYLPLPKLFHHKGNYQRDVITFLPWNGSCTTLLSSALLTVGSWEPLSSVDKSPPISVSVMVFSE